MTPRPRVNQSSCTLLPQSHSATSICALGILTVS
jgi:hypothetical protein